VLKEEDVKSELSNSIPELTDELIESLYKQVKSQQKTHNDTYVTSTKKVINPHIPGHQKRQMIPNAKFAEKPQDKRENAQSRKPVSKPKEADPSEQERREQEKRAIMVKFREDSREPPAGYEQKRREINERLEAKTRDASPPVKQSAQSDQRKKHLTRIDNALNQNVNSAM
jgi:hypothetical protein